MIYTFRFWLHLHYSTASLPHIRRWETAEAALWNRHNRLSLCFPGGTLYALVSASLTTTSDQIHHDMWTTKSYNNAWLGARVHNGRLLRSECALSPQNTSLFPCTRKHYMSHNTAKSLSSVSNGEKPCQIALLDTKCSAAAEMEFFFSPQIKPGWKWRESSHQYVAGNSLN